MGRRSHTEKRSKQNYNLQQPLAPDISILKKKKSYQVFLIFCLRKNDLRDSVSLYCSTIALTMSQSFELPFENTSVDRMQVETINKIHGFGPTRCVCQ